MFSIFLCSQSIGKFAFVVDDNPDGTRPTLLFTENETNMEDLYQTEHYTKFARDGFHKYVVNGMYIHFCAIIARLCAIISVYTRHMLWSSYSDSGALWRGMFHPL